MEFVFLKFDPDKTGCIDGEEMYELMEEVDPSISRSEIDQLRKSLEKSSYVDLYKVEEYLLNKHPDASMEKLKLLNDEKYMMDIHTAAWHGHAAVIARKKEDTNAVDDCPEFGDRNTALHYAAYNGKLGACRVLLEHNANVNAVNGTGCTPLFYAAQQEHASIVKCLLEAGADATLRIHAEDKLSALDVCLSKEVLSVFKASKGSKPNQPVAPLLKHPLSYSFDMTWKEPSMACQTMPTSGYKIRIFNVDTKDATFMLVKSMPLYTELIDLNPNTTYTVQVAAINIFGASEYSPASTNITTMPAPESKQQEFSPSKNTTDDIYVPKKPIHEPADEDFSIDAQEKTSIGVQEKTSIGVQENTSIEIQEKTSMERNNQPEELHQAALSLPKKPALPAVESLTPTQPPSRANPSPFQSKTPRSSHTPRTLAPIE